MVSGGDRLLEATRRVLDEHLAPGACLVLGLSGGPDSTALAYLVAAARPDLRLVVGHVRHGLRDDAADARVARAHATALGLPFHERRVTVEQAGEGLEAAARSARYAALGEVAALTGASGIAVGHTADDQAETVLLNIGRGCGLAGIAGMSPCRAEGPLRLVRPLLRSRRADVRSFVDREALIFVTDPSNDDPDQRRARVRREVLPALARLSGGTGDPVAALTRLADLARDDAEALEELARRATQHLVVRWGAVHAVPVEELAELPRAVRSRVLRHMLGKVRGGLEGLAASTITDVLELRAGQALHVPGGVWVTAGAGWLAAAPPGLADLPARSVAVPGVTPLPEAGVTLRVAEAAAATEPEDIAERLPLRRPSGPACAVVPVELAAGLVVRSWTPGDRLRLPGGRRKVADVMSDAGVPRALRGLVPVVADAAGEPVWVPWLGLRAALPASCEPALRLWLAPLA